MTLSVVIITKDEERDIERCIEQVKWANEIIVVDAFSQDRTIEIAKRHTDKIVLRKWSGFAGQRSFALTLATCDLVLVLDADEVLDERLKDELKEIISSKEVYDGYYITIDTYFLGRRLSFAERPFVKMRLFKNGRGFVKDEALRLVNEEYDVFGRTKIVDGRIKHYTDDTIAERVKKINLYSTLWAEERFECKQPLPIIATYAFFKSFIGNFFVRGGFLDGFHGFIWCVLKALENFLKYAKLYLHNN